MRATLRAIVGVTFIVGTAACQAGSATTPDMAMSTLRGPAAPTISSVTKLGAGGHVKWMDASTDEDEFTIMRKSGAGAYAEIARVPFNTTQFHDEPLTVGATYTYRVMASNAAGDTASNEVAYTHQ